MNQVILMGRLTKDPEVTVSQGEKPLTIAAYTLAVDKRRRVRDGEAAANFIRCKAFGANGEFAEKYLRKGTKILVRGRIETGSYTNKDGQTVYTTEVYVDEHEFAESKGSESATPTATGAAVAEGFTPIPDGADELPWMG